MAAMVVKAKILLIDDDPLVLKTLARVLKANGYEATAVDSGKKAIKQVEKEDFDLIMSDIRMPEMDGVEAVKIIEEHYKHRAKSCAAMFITAYPEDHRIKEIKRSSRTRLVLKPFEIEDLLASIRLELEERPSFPVGKD